MAASQEVEKIRALLKDTEALADRGLSFLSAYTKNPDLQQLREHVGKVKTNLASQLHVYGCIDRNLFLMPRVNLHQFYPQLRDRWVANYAANKPYKVADVGCCFGTDTRQLILDGVHAEDIHSIDVHSGYWDFGLELFGDKDSLKVNTLFTDVSVPQFGAEHSELTNKFDLIYSGAVIHVFAKDEGENFIHNIYNMLTSGGIFYGSTGVALAPSQTDMPTPRKDKCRYLYSAESLGEYFKSVGFINVRIEEFARPSESGGDPDSPIKKFVVFFAEKA